MAKKVYEQKMFFSLITKNVNWEILTKNLVTFKRWVKRWDGAKDENFQYYGGTLKKKEGGSIFEGGGYPNIYIYIL